MKPVAQNRVLVLALMILFALAALIRLGDNVLWQDEAETALIAFATTQRGLPNVDLGQNIVFEGGHHFNENHIWTWQTWMQYYLGAASFLLLGKSAFAARLPFALFGILCIPMTAWLGRSVSGIRAIGTLSALFLTFNVPFLLFSRQSRNYTLVTFAVILLLLAYARFIKNKKQGSVLLALLLALTFHCHILIFGGVVIGLLFHYSITNIRSLRDIWAITIPLSIAFALTFPWFLYAGGFDQPGQLTFAAFVPKIVRFLVWINNYLFPFVLLGIPVLGLCFSRFRPSALPRYKGHRMLSLLTVFPLTSIFVWCFCSQIFFRYLVVWIPVAAVLLASCFHWLWKSNIPGKRLLCLAIVLLHLFTNLLPILPVRLLAPPLAKQFNSVYLKAKGKKEWLLSVQYLSTSVAVLRRMAFEHPFGADHTNQCMWRQMIYELTYGTRGPMDAIVEYINTHAEPGDLLWTGYGDLPLIFHTDTKVISWYMTALEPGSYRNADWILPRAFTPFYLMLHGKLRVAGAGKYTREFPPHLAANYEQVSLRIKDAPCNNRPDPDSHTFRTSFGQPFVHIFHRKTLKKP